MITTTEAFIGDAFAAFKKFVHARERGLFFLDSSLKGARGRFSFIGFSPYDVIEGKNFQSLQDKISKSKRAKVKAVGYIGYDGRLYFGLYDQWLCFDHVQKTVSLHAPDRLALNRVCGILAEGAMHVPQIKPQKFILKSNFTKKQYEGAVRKALEHIARGNIYQINLSRKVAASFQHRPDPVALYSALRAHSPSPFSAYFDDGTRIILSSSPEQFLRSKDGLVEVKPMKGTRPRGRNATEDLKFKKDLQKSAKEQAELLMVTDLERNDLGRVCDYGSVRVRTKRRIETYASVFQATAVIEGKLHKGKNIADLLKATFPSGSVTGCPKIAAMAIIDEIENAPRGLYTGALGHIDPSGNMDLSVLIRALFLEKNAISFYVGGGIVADSDPAQEYEETCVKARPMEKTLAEVFRADN